MVQLSWGEPWKCCNATQDIIQSICDLQLITAQTLNLVPFGQLWSTPYVKLTRHVQKNENLLVQAALVAYATAVS